MDSLFVAAIITSSAALVLIMRGVDVRLVLMTAALLLAALAGNMLRIFDVFLSKMGDGTVIGPICSAMGFAYVLRATGCDREMVRMLMLPLRRFRSLLIPGGCVVGFLTNMAITSQTASAAAVGPILIPLMLAAGYHPVVAAATLILGCSAGGNLFNPGEPDIVTIQANTGVQVHSVIASVSLPELGAFTIAVLLFTLFSLRRHSTETIELPREDESGPISIIRALLPPLPIVMLFVLMPSFRIVPLVAEWYPDGFPVVHAMLTSTIIACVIVRKDLSSLTKQFFEGLGFGYAHVISLIITAGCFIESLKMCGLMETLVRSIASGGMFGYVSSAASTMALALVSGSGTAPSIAFSKAVLPGLVEQGIAVENVVDIGSLAAIGATFGRTMSPVAAIVIFASTLTYTKTTDIVKQLSLPLLAGMCVAVTIMILTTAR